MRAWEFRGDREGADRLRDELAGPDYPPELEYLLDWLDELHGRSGAGPHGASVLTWECFDAWQRATGVIVYPHEARALMLLDAIRCHPDAGRPDDGDDGDSDG